MFRVTGIIVLALGLVGVGVLPSGAQPAEPGKDTLGWGAGKPEGKRSVAGSGYATVFEAEEGKPVLQSVWVHACRYGRQEPRDFALVVSDQKLVPVAVFGIPYEVLDWGANPSWKEIRLPEEVRPPKQFAVTLYCHCLQDFGVYMSWEGTTKDDCLSYLITQNTPKPLDIQGKPANWLMRCQMAAAFTPAPGPNSPVQLKHDDGAPDGIQSLGGRGQAVRFRTPDNAAYVVERVLICAAFYGRPQDGAANQFEVNVLDPAGLRVGVKLFRYDEFYWGDKPGWASVPMGGEVEVSGDFYILTNMNSRQTPGVYVGYDTNGTEDNSMVGLPGQLQDWQPPKADKARTNWCIRCVVRKK